MKQILPALLDLLNRGEPVALATVITQNGSAPRGAGAKMLVTAGGQTLGTVGGGILEAQTERLAAQIAAEQRAVIQRFDFSGKDAATMDAICGGRVEVLVEWIDPAARAVFQGLREAVEQHRKAWLVTRLPAEGARTSHALVGPDGALTGELPDGLPVQTVLDSRAPAQIDLPGARLMIEPVDINGTVYIFGAGHVSRSLAEFTKAVGFWTVVLDDRAEYVNCERFPTADQLIVLENFDNCLAGLTIDRDSYIVIVTRGHLNDRTVLAQALQTDAGYIGMIGSRRKTELVYRELRRQGVTDAALARVRAPIGLPIAAETPEEIGVSIVAEMIQVRAGDSL